jgi:hypothetical protein
MCEFRAHALGPAAHKINPKGHPAAFDQPVQRETLPIILNDNAAMIISAG